MSGATEGTWAHGPAVLHDGTPGYSSVTALELALECPRKWFYRYVLRIRPPQTAAQDRGTRLHAQTASYLRTNVKALDAQAMRGAFMMPPPGPDLLVEQPLHGDDLSRAPLTFDGIPIVGALDLAHARRVNYGTEDIMQANDPPGTIEVCDWKFPGKMDHARAPSELPSLIQMAGYAEWVFRRWPQVPRVRISHGYMPVKGRPMKSSVVVTRDQIAPGIARAESAAQVIRHVARLKVAEQVPANTRACGNYGGCPHRTICEAGMTGTLDAFLGRTSAANVLAGGHTSMSIIQKIGAPQAQPDPAAAAMAALQADNAAQPPPEFAGWVAAIERSGGGMPGFSGNAARAYGILRGYALAGGYAGGGPLGAITLTEVDHVRALVDTLADPTKANQLALDLARAAAAKVAPPPPPPVAPPPVTPTPWAQAPAPAPLPAAPPWAQADAATPTCAAESVRPWAPSIVPPETPPSGALAAAPPAPAPPAPAGDISAATAEKPKRARKAKAPDGPGAPGAEPRDSRALVAEAMRLMSESMKLMSEALASEADA